MAGPMAHVTEHRQIWYEGYSTRKYLSFLQIHKISRGQCCWCEYRLIRLLRSNKLQISHKRCHIQMRTKTALTISSTFFLFRSLHFCFISSWWHHQIKTISALLAICAGNSPVPDEFPAQRPVTRSFHVFFDLRLDKRLSKHSWGWWFETLSRPLWCHSNVMICKVFKHALHTYIFVVKTFCCAFTFLQVVWLRIYQQQH